MTWQETHHRLQLLREVEEVIARRNDDQLPWREEYDEVFGDADGLRAALAYRVRLARQAQLDPNLHQEDWEETHRDLTQRHLAVLRVLRSTGVTGDPELLRVPA